MEKINNQTIEATLIGTGGGYGESIVIHLGDQNWMVVDSCQDPNTHECLPLEYLKSLNVNTKRNVKLIVCTHWHDDHIRGISKLLKECPSAIFTFAQTTDRKKFLQFVGLDYKKLKNETSTSSTYELQKSLDILRKRNQPIKEAVQDRLLLKKSSKELFFEIFSLSPSDKILDNFNQEIAALITDYGCSNKKTIIDSPNDKSVVIFIKVNNIRFLLGSDMEVSNDKNKGWECIKNNCQCIDKKSILYKIPHHGSINGYNRAIFEGLVSNEAVSLLSPYNRGKKLPKKDMLINYLNHTELLYITSDTFNKPKPKKREKSMAKAISRFNKTLYEVPFKKGIIQCRMELKNTNSWTIKLFGEANKISKKNLDLFE